MPEFKVSFWKIFSVVGAVSAWASKAFQDGKIDAMEAAELAESICEVLGVDAEINLPKEMTPNG